MSSFEDMFESTLTYFLDTIAPTLPPEQDVQQAVCILHLKANQLKARHVRREAQRATRRIEPEATESESEGTLSELEAALTFTGEEDSDDDSGNGGALSKKQQERYELQIQELQEKVSTYEPRLERCERDYFLFTQDCSRVPPQHVVDKETLLNELQFLKAFGVPQVANVKTKSAGEKERFRIIVQQYFSEPATEVFFHGNTPQAFEQYLLPIYPDVLKYITEVIECVSSVQK